MTFENSPFALGAIVKETIDLFRPQAAEKGLRLILELSPAAAITVVGDCGRLQQVLMNLLSNALKFTHSGEVNLTVGRKPSRGVPIVMEFAVSDTGIGIPTSQLPEIFEDFTQADPWATRKYGGTGLGLGVCRRIVSMMSGQIEVESIPGEGSTFSFWLPFQPAQVAEGAAARMQPLDGFNAEEPPLRMNILIAEDNDKNQKLLKAYLAKSGHTFTLVEDGQAALEKAEQGGFDMVLMDVHMPKMDGLAAARAIRERETKLGLDPLPILALTADTGAEESSRSLAAGCNAHLTKPISKATLLSAIRKHARLRPGAAPAVLSDEWHAEAGPMTIN